MACEDLFQGLMRDSHPCIRDPGVGVFRVLMEVHIDLPRLTVIFDGIGKKIIDEDGSPVSWRRRLLLRPVASLSRCLCFGLGHGLVLTLHIL